jgi:hypothetical protein
MSITNTSKPTTSLSNVSKPFGGETWASILTTWATETQTWIEVSQIIDNISKPTTSITNIAKPV